MQAQTIDVLHGVIRVLQAAHMQDPPTGDLPRVPRPFDEIEPAQDAVSLADFNHFLKG